MTRDKLRSIGVVLAASLALGACSVTQTFTDETDPNAPPAAGSLGKDILAGLGAVEDDKPTVNYQPRAPLVMPSSTAALPAPDDASNVAQMSDWPVDPDVQRAARLRDAARRGQSESGYVANSDMPDLPLGSGPAPTSAYQRMTARDPSKPVPSTKLARMEALRGGGGGGAGNAELYDANGQPVRRRLVAPPTTYLQPADQYPVAVPSEDEQASSGKGWFDWF